MSHRSASCDAMSDAVELPFFRRQVGTDTEAIIETGGV